MSRLAASRFVVSRFAVSRFAVSRFAATRFARAAVLGIAVLCAVPRPAVADEIATSFAAIPSLRAPVAIDLDPAGIPTIRGESMEDAVRAQGWIHARDRFLQMDLARRQAAGELGALFPQAIASDRLARPLGLRAIAKAALDRLPVAQLALLEAYAEGVNTRIAGEPPLEYRMLRTAPEPWRPEDTLLVQLGMAKYLDSSAEADLERAELVAKLGPEVGMALASALGPQSMSVDGSPLPAPPPLPSADRIDLRKRSRAERRESDSPADGRETVPGSNAFAVAGSRTHDGRAIVANDMHLMLTAPGIWYRIALEWQERGLVGLSLPGVPLIVQGTNGKVAWGFTNLTADLSDVVVLDPDPSRPGHYLTGDGSLAFETEEVELGAAPRTETLVVRRSCFGPIVGETPDGRPLALRWVFLDPAAIDCGLFAMSLAGTLEEALDAARDWRGPPQNVLVADDRGRIGWTIAGSLPDRDMLSPAPLPWRMARPWRGILDPARKPRIADPDSGVLTSGNQLSVAPEGALAATMGFAEAPGDRAERMRVLLTARSDWNEASLHAVQLDTYSRRLVRWRDAMVALVPASAGDEITRAARGVLADWDGFVGADASAPEIIDACRRLMRSACATALGLDSPQGMSDEAILRMVESRAPHLAPDPSGDWPAAALRVLAAAAAETRAAPVVNGNAATGRDPADKPEATARDDAREHAAPPARGPSAGTPQRIEFRTRGSANVSAIRHPAADSLGPAARIAEMPRVPLPGHPTCVRVQTPTFGASERSVVSPAYLEDAILVTPAGQAGMPTSPHFRDLHLPWMRGQPYPLLPKPVKSRIELRQSIPDGTAVDPRGTAVDPRGTAVDPRGTAVDPRAHRGG